MSDHAVNVANLRKVFSRGGRGHDVVAVDDVSFSVARGSSLAIVGESGSGKTTCARIIAGLETATSGQLEINGQAQETGRLTHRKRGQRARDVQMVFQDPRASLDPMQTVGAALVEVLGQQTSLSRTERRARALELLDQVGLDERAAESLPRHMSGGQRQRVAIARALAADTDILILDEAVSALDVSVQAQVLRLLQELREIRQLTYVFVSHDLGVVRQISDMCVVMNQGRVVETGPTERVLDSPAEQYTRELISAVPGPGWVPRRRKVSVG